MAAATLAFWLYNNALATVQETEAPQHTPPLRNQQRLARRYAVSIVTNFSNAPLTVKKVHGKVSNHGPGLTSREEIFLRP
jgi:hypothetical protein